MRIAGLWAGILGGTVIYLYKKQVPVQLKIIQVREGIGGAYRHRALRSQYGNQFKYTGP
jgi:hypothetical protein